MDERQRKWQLNTVFLLSAGGDWRQRHLSDVSGMEFFSGQPILLSNKDENRHILISPVLTSRIKPVF